MTHFAKCSVFLVTSLLLVPYLSDASSSATPPEKPTPKCTKGMSWGYTPPTYKPKLGDIKIECRHLNPTNPAGSSEIGLREDQIVNSEWLKTHTIQLQENLGVALCPNCKHVMCLHCLLGRIKDCIKEIPTNILATTTSADTLVTSIDAVLTGTPAGTIIDITSLENFLQTYGEAYATEWYSCPNCDSSHSLIYFHYLEDFQVATHAELIDTLRARGIQVEEKQKKWAMRYRKNEHNELEEYQRLVGLSYRCSQDACCSTSYVYAKNLGPRFKEWNPFLEDARGLGYRIVNKW